MTTQTHQLEMTVRGPIGQIDCEGENLHLTVENGRRVQVEYVGANIGALPDAVESFEDLAGTIGIHALRDRDMI